MVIFKELILMYNELLEKLCKEYQISFVDMGKIGEKYNTSENNFHITNAGHKALANHILDCMYERKFKNIPKISNREKTCIVPVLDSISMVLDLMGDLIESEQKAKSLEGYAKKRELDIADEHRREMEVFRKVLIKRKK